MEMSSAIELQDRIFRDIFDYEEVDARDVQAFGMVEAQGVERVLVDPALAEPSRRAGSRKRVPKSDIAIGIAQGPEERGARIAVLVQDRSLLASSIIDDIDAKAKGEAKTVFIGRQRANWPRSSSTPVRIGSSISTTRRKTAGTLGCYCRDNVTGRLGVLSNNHVIADSNAAPVSTKIVQPGRLDGGNVRSDRIATLQRFVPLRFGTAINAVDAAFAELDGHGRGDDMLSVHATTWPPCVVLSLRTGSPTIAVPGMTVHKSGRTTGFTCGRVNAVNVNNYKVGYGPLGAARFDGQIAIEAMNPPVPFSYPGDSGSIVVDDQGRPIGLLFAGSRTGGAGNVGVTGANPISSVISALNITLV